MWSLGEEDELETVQNLKAGHCGWKVGESKAEREQNEGGQVVWGFVAHTQRQWSKMPLMVKTIGLRKASCRSCEGRTGLWQLCYLWIKAIPQWSFNPSTKHTTPVQNFPVLGEFKSPCVDSQWRHSCPPAQGIFGNVWRHILLSGFLEEVPLASRGKSSPRDAAKHPVMPSQGSSHNTELSNKTSSTPRFWNSG